jgi:hypothetical protein
MSAELSNRSVPASPAQDALAEMRDCQHELQTFVTGLFDRLEGLAKELLAQETTPQQAPRQMDRNLMQNELSQLAAVATDLADLVAEQKRLLANRKPR